MIQPLGKQEWAALEDRSYLPLKHRVTAYIEAQLLETGRRLQADLSSSVPGFLPDVLRQTPGRLSRGEAYLEQAYRVYDFPRFFDKEDFFLFRCLVLWGHHISFHLILSGRFAADWGPGLMKQTAEIAPDWRWATQADPWVWDQDAAGWIDLDHIESHELYRLGQGLPYCKFSRFLPLDNLPGLPQLGTENWAFWLQRLQLATAGQAR